MRWRRERFGNGFEFYAPGLKRWQTSEWRPEKAHRFVSISVTGTACALQCDHCKAKVLEGMITPSNGDSLFDIARRLRQRGTDGVLISGGSTRTGEVPLAPHVDDMRRIKDELGMRVIVHSGVVSPDLAQGLTDAAVDGVMLDVIGADETVRDVYHLDLSAADFERSLALLARAELRIIPHIVLGLHYGQFLGEWDALEMIARYPVSTLVLVVMTPLVGTPMASLEPPPLDDTTAFFALARQALPDTRVNLGCGRPMGAMKIALDKAAVDNGLNGIAFPADGIIDYAERSGLTPEYYEYCCSLTWSH
ncbi:MAG: radical SAM protein [Acidobacteriota bacterium]|nr:radical SAM protein [Acidobacteriota bacterium]